MPRYPWPASALEPADMRMLHAARERVRPRIPITELLAQAVRRVYTQVEPTNADQQPTSALPEAA